MGYYYDNEEFLGSPIKIQDKNIDFEWNQGNVIENINDENFSAIWKGYLKFPVTTEYIFSLDCSDRCQMTLNG